MARALGVDGLPYRARVYINNQVLVPAVVVRGLGMGRVRHAWVIIRYRGFEVGFKTLLLGHRGTCSRQFTIPRWVRERYGIRPLDEVEVLTVKPLNDEAEEVTETTDHIAHPTEE